MVCNIIDLTGSNMQEGICSGSAKEGLFMFFVKPSHENNYSLTYLLANTASKVVPSFCMYVSLLSR